MARLVTIQRQQASKQISNFKNYSIYLILINTPNIANTTRNLTCINR